MANPFQNDRAKTKILDEKDDEKKKNQKYYRRPYY